MFSLCLSGGCVACLCVHIFMWECEHVRAGAWVPWCMYEGQRTTLNVNPSLLSGLKQGLLVTVSHRCVSRADMRSSGNSPASSSLLTVGK